MANLIPTQNALSIPPDASLAAGLPVAGSTIRHLAQLGRWTYEVITGGIVPGESAASLAKTGEHDRPHDHTGLVGGYDHGMYRGIVGSAPMRRLLCQPFASWPSGWDGDQDGIDPGQPYADAAAVWPSGWDKKYGFGWWALNFTKAYNSGTGNVAAFCGMCKIRVPRGTNRLTVRQIAFQADATSGLTAGEIWWAVVDASGDVIDSDSATLANTDAPGTHGYAYEQTATLDVAASGATLAADTDLWLWCGLKALDTSGNTKTLVCADSIEYYTTQA
jgi:hypothetical protein